MSHPITIIHAMRTILKEQCTYSYMDESVKRFIFEEAKLLRVVEWPAFCIVITDAGVEYIRENEEV